MLPENLPFYRRLLEPNPVLVRELKQFVRNRLLLYFMLSYLGVLSVVTILAMLDPSLLDIVETITFDLASFRGPASTGLFRTVLLGYFAFTSTFLILFGAIKMGFERLNNDLGYYTTLSPWRVISGKFLLGVIVSMIFLSIALPFLTIAYMMRGIGLDVVIYSAIYFFLYTLIQYSVTLAFFSGAKTLKRVYLFATALLLVQLFAFFIGFGVGYGYLEGELTRPQYIWPGIFIESLFIFMPLPLAVCQVSPESANRMLPIRLAMTAAIFLLVLSVFMQFLNAQFHWGFDGLENAFYGLGFFVYLFLPYAVLIGICEREQYTIRQRLHIPRSTIGRLLLFPFGTGVYNAMAWFFGFLLFLVVFYWFLDYTPNIGFYSHVIDHSFVEEVLRICVPFAILIFDYAVTAFLLWKLVLHRFISREWLAFGVFGLSIGFYLTLFVVEMFGNYRWIQSMSSACFFLPVILPDIGRGIYDTQLYQTFLAVTWGVFLFLIMLFFWLNAFFRFTRYQGSKLSPPEK